MIRHFFYIFTCKMNTDIVPSITVVVSPGVWVWRLLCVLSFVSSLIIFPLWALNDSSTPASIFAADYPDISGEWVMTDGEYKALLNTSWSEQKKSGKIGKEIDIAGQRFFTMTVGPGGGALHNPTTADEVYGCVFLQDFYFTCVDGDELAILNGRVSKGGSVLEYHYTEVVGSTPPLVALYRAERKK